MTDEQCLAFLKALGAKQIRSKSSGWVEATCPLAPWLHKSGADQHPSFALLVKPGERSYFSCFTCKSGSAEELIQILELYTKDTAHHFDFSTCRQLLDEELKILPLPEYAEHQPEGSQFQAWPQYWLDSFQKTGWVKPAIHYLDHRKVSPKTQEQFDLRFDPKRQMIVAPYWDAFGQFAGARGRSILGQVSGAQKHFDYSFQGRNNARFCWYNEKVLNLYGPIVVVEGQFDCWRVAQVFPKVVAALTAKPTWDKMKKLVDSGLVIHIPDNPKVDAAGAESMQVYRKFCTQLQLRYHPIILDEGAKDPDECHPDYLRDRIQEAL